MSSYTAFKFWVSGTSLRKSSRVCLVGLQRTEKKQTHMVRFFYLNVHWCSVKKIKELPSKPFALVWLFDAMTVVFQPS